MFRLLVAFIAMTSAVEAATFTTFQLRYDTAPFLNHTSTNPGGPDPVQDQRLGQASWLEVFLQIEGLLPGLQDGVLSIRSDQYDYFHAEVSGSEGYLTLFDLSLTVSGGTVSSWFGYAVDGSSGDGLFIDSAGTDMLQPFEGDHLQSIAAGSWSVQSVEQRCFTDVPFQFISCSGPLPPPISATVPLPATLPALGVAVAALVGLARRRTGRFG